MGRIAPKVEGQLTDNQAIFRPFLYCGYVANLTQYIKDDFQTCTFTGTVCADLSATYNTVNHCACLLKLVRIVRNRKMDQVISFLLENRQFFAEMVRKADCIPNRIAPSFSAITLDV